MSTVKAPKIDYDKKTITCRKEFMILAGQYGTKEFMEYQDLRKHFPDFQFITFSITRNPKKHSYGKLTYETMQKFIMGYEDDDDERKKMLATYETIKMVSKKQPGSYGRVKKWFLSHYGEAFQKIEEERIECRESKKNEKTNSRTDNDDE